MHSDTQTSSPVFLCRHRVPSLCPPPHSTVPNPVMRVSALVSAVWAVPVLAAPNLWHLPTTSNVLDSQVIDSASSWLQKVAYGAKKEWVGPEHDSVSTVNVDMVDVHGIECESPAPLGRSSLSFPGVTRNQQARPLISPRSIPHPFLLSAPPHASGQARIV